VEETQLRTRNPWGQGDRLRGEILEAADRLLSELGGVQALTIRGIARAVGIAPASIYQHFGDKDALVKGLTEYYYQHLAAAMREADLSCDEDDSLGRVRAQMHAYCRFAIDSPGHYRLIMNNRPHREPDGRPEGPLASIVREVIAALERCEKTGRVLRLPVERAAVMVFVAAHGRVALSRTLRIDEDEVLISAFIDELISLVFV
jgi:AcrR family transcriptional regulator